jgi:hypothetical protein
MPTTAVDKRTSFFHSYHFPFRPVPPLSDLVLLHAKNTAPAARRLLVVIVTRAFPGRRKFPGSPELRPKQRNFPKGRRRVIKSADNKKIRGLCTSWGCWYQDSTERPTAQLTFRCGCASSAQERRKRRFNSALCTTGPRISRPRLARSEIYNSVKRTTWELPHLLSDRGEPFTHSPHLMGFWNSMRRAGLDSAAATKR